MTNKNIIINNNMSSTINNNSNVFESNTELLKINKYMIKHIAISKLNNKELDIDFIVDFYKNLPRFKKSPKALLEFEILYVKLKKGQMVFFNGQYNAFERYIDGKLFSELKEKFPSLTKKEFENLLSEILKYDIFSNLLKNKSIIRSRNKII